MNTSFNIFFLILTSALFLLTFFNETFMEVKELNFQNAWREVIATAVQLGIPTPAFSAALAFYDGYRCGVLPANLIQVCSSFYMQLFLSYALFRHSVTISEHTLTSSKQTLAHLCIPTGQAMAEESPLTHIPHNFAYTQHCCCRINVNGLL